VYPSRRNLPLRTRAVIEFLTEVVRADPAMSNHSASFSTGAAFDASGGRATY